MQVLEQGLGRDAKSPTSVRVIDSASDLVAEVSRLRAIGGDIGFDIETTSLDPFTDKLVTLAFKPKGKRTVVVDVRHVDPDGLMLFGAILAPLFDGTVTLVGMSLKFDLSWVLVKMGLAATKLYDMMIAELVILGLGMHEAGDKGIHLDMASIAGRYGVEVSKEERKWFIGLDQATRVTPSGRPEWNEPLPAEQLAYIRQDVAVPHKVKEAQQAAIDKYGLAEVIDLEMSFLPVVVGKEVWGVQIERDGWLSVIDRVSKIAKDLERVVHLGNDRHDGLDIHILKVRQERYMDKWHPYEDWMKARDAFVATRRADWDSGVPASMLGYKTWSEYKKATLDHWYEEHGKNGKPPENKSGANLGSWMQVRDGFNDLGIPVKGVSEEELTPYIGKHLLVQVFIDYQHARKIETVYGRERGKKKRSFIEMLDATGRLRARYHQIGPGTGRESSLEPNLQQIPKAGVGADLRKYVVPAPGYTFVIADYNSIELRITAEYSHDPFLLGAFTSGVDIHSYTAGVMFHLLPEQINKEWTNSHNVVLNGREIENVPYRDVAKTINYMLLYGAGKTRLAVELHIPEADAEKLLKMYYDTFAVAIGWLDTQKSRLDAARRKSETRIYSTTKSGRVRWFDIPAYPKMPKGKVSEHSNGDMHVLPASVEDVEKYQADQAAWRKKMASIRRQLANSPIQGTSADITKWAASQWYRQFGYDNEMRLVACVHDEIICEVKQDMAEYASLALQDVMMQAMSTYLKTVDLGQVHEVIVPYWSH